jgi:hypothetical protein
VSRLAPQVAFLWHNVVGAVVVVAVGMVLSMSATSDQRPATS